MTSCKLISGYENIYRLGRSLEKQTHSLYKYMNGQRAMDFLQTGEFSFVEPIVWTDPYEKRFYLADYKNTNYQPKQLFCTCFTSKISNEAAWKMYRADGGGIASRTIRFDFQRSILLRALAQYEDAKFYLGCANYNYTTKQIDELHKKTNPEYEHFFKDFSDEKFMNLLLIKRKAFEYESEVRLFMIPNDRESIFTISESEAVVYHIRSIVFDNTTLKKMIKQISVDPSCSTIEYEMIESLIMKILPDIPCKKNGLYKNKSQIIIE